MNTMGSCSKIQSISKNSICQSNRPNKDIFGGTVNCDLSIAWKCPKEDKKFRGFEFWGLSQRVVHWNE